MRGLTIASLASCVSILQAGSTFDHGKVYRINRDDRIETETWKVLGEYIEVQMGDHVDIWNANRQFIDVQVPENLAEIYEEFMKGFDLEPSVMVDDVKALIEETMVRVTDGFDYQQYNTEEVIKFTE